MKLLLIVCSLVLFLNKTKSESFNVTRSKRWSNDNACCVPEVGGNLNNVAHGQWPFIAAVYHIVSDRAYFICGGTIISNYFVLTDKSLMLISVQFKINKIC